MTRLSVLSIGAFALASSAVLAKSSAGQVKLAGDASSTLPSASSSTSAALANATASIAPLLPDSATMDVPGATETPLEFASSDTACTETYTVEAGDTCDKVGQKTWTSTYHIMQFNLISGPLCYGLEIGSTLCLGRYGNDCQNVHRVQGSDTCNSIARDFSISRETLINNNPSINCNNLYDGLMVCVSDGSIRPPPDASLDHNGIRQKVAALEGNDSAAASGTTSTDQGGSAIGAKIAQAAGRKSKAQSNKAKGGAKVDSKVVAEQSTKSKAHKKEHAKAPAEHKKQHAKAPAEHKAKHHKAEAEPVKGTASANASSASASAPNSAASATASQGAADAGAQSPGQNPATGDGQQQAAPDAPEWLQQAGAAAAAGAQIVAGLAAYGNEFTDRLTTPSQ